MKQIFTSFEQRLKYFLFVGLLSFSVHSFGQEDQEIKWMLSCSGGLTSAGQVKMHSLSGRVGGFATEKFALGIDGGHMGLGIGDVDWRVLDLGPYIRYYHFENNMGAFFGAQGSFALNTQSENQLYGTAKDQYQSLLFGPDLGIDIFLNSSTAIEVLIHYQFEEALGEVGQGGAALVAEFGLTVFL